MKWLIGHSLFVSSDSRLLELLGSSIAGLGYDNTMNIIEQSTKIYTVSELNGLAQAALEDRFPNPIWIEGEITNYRQGSGDHLYFSLKDAQAEVRCAYFGGGRQRGMAQIMENGLQALVLAEVSLWPKAGVFQLYVRAVEPRGSGALQLAFEKLKKKLEAEGLFNPATKRPLPVIIQHLALVTSPDGAVVHDILRILKNAPMTITIIPAAVQGEGAADSISEAIRAAGTIAPLVDILVVARGGGSLEDLWAFNEEPVARALHECPVITISAIGHETDFTIADFAADCRAPTPTAAAQLILSQNEQAERRLKEFSWRLIKHLRGILEKIFGQLAHFKHLLTPQKLERLLADKFLTLDHLNERLILAIHNRLEVLKNRLDSLRSQLELISPNAVLARGYAIVSMINDSRPIREAAGLKSGDLLKIRLWKEEIICETKSVGR
ncbi:MAG: exodeoxyribonuclease VII large subunit [Elusimicrobia bacterium]|nr:exodeoxyribonuclease VII large subunit [Elusimicrobiota bacterium]